MKFSFLSVRRHMLAAVAFISVAVDAYAERVNVGNLWFETDPATGTARVASPQEGDLTFDMVEKVYSSDNVIVPSSIEHDGIIFTVTSVGPFAFSKSEVESVSLPPSIESIEPSAFRGAGKIKEIVIPAGAVLNEGAFRNANNLTKVVLPENIRDIPKNAFNGTALKSISLPSTVSGVNSYCFKGVPLTDGVFLNDGLERIEVEAFSSDGENNTTGLTEIVIPASVNTIHEHAFHNSAITTLWFGGSPQNIKTYSSGAKTSFAGMPVDTIVWGSGARPVANISVGVGDESQVVLYYNNSYENFKDIGPSLKVAVDPDSKVATVSPKRKKGEVLAYIPPVSFAARTIDLSDYAGSCQLADLTYESSDQDIASVNGTIVTFHKAGVVTIKTSSVSEAPDKPIVGKERRFCIMPVTVAVTLDDTGNNIIYSSNQLTEQQIKGMLTEEARIASVRVRDEEGGDWKMRYAAGASGNGLEFVYGTMAPERSAPEVALPKIDRTLCYGDDPIDMSEIDASILAEGHVVSYISSDEKVLKIEGSTLIPVGVGDVAVTTVEPGVEFAENGMRTLRIDPRKVMLKGKNVTVEDDVEHLPPVDFEIEGLVGNDEPSDIVTSWDWKDAFVEEGVYSASEPMICDNPLYEVEIVSDQVCLYVVRAVTRPVAELDFNYSRGTGSSLKLELSGVCRIACGYGVINGQPGTAIVDLDNAVAAGGCRVHCDYPERITGISITDAGATRIEISEGLENLTSLDFSGNNLIPGSLIVPADIIGNGNVKVGEQSRVAAMVDGGCNVSIGDVPLNATVAWFDKNNVELLKGSAFTFNAGIYTFLRSIQGVYADISDGLVSVRTIPVDVKVRSTESGDGQTSAMSDIKGATESRIVNVYNMGGILVRSGISIDDALTALPPGTYVIDGKVYNVR